MAMSKYNAVWAYVKNVGSPSFKLASPVYVYHATGAMKALLDRDGWRWMVHRPKESMFPKQAVCISTAAGAGMKSTNRDMADSNFEWGVARTYRYGVAVAETTCEKVSEQKKQRVDKKLSLLAQKILNVKNSYEAAKMYCKAFGAEITRVFKNENDTAYEHCELSVDGEGILALAEAVNPCDIDVVHKMKWQTMTFNAFSGLVFSGQSIDL